MAADLEKIEATEEVDSDERFFDANEIPFEVVEAVEAGEE